MNQHLDKDPSSELGVALGKRCMDWVNYFYGKKYVALRNAIWEKGFEKGKIDSDNAPSPECCAWLDKAITAYYRKRIFAVLNLIGQLSDAEVLQQWQELITEMHGDEIEPKHEIVNKIMHDDKVNSTIKQWLKQHMK